MKNRYGPAPVLDPVAVDVAVQNQINIVSAFGHDAGITIVRSSDWYYVAEAGFNYIDDECASYFDHIFFLNRDRQALEGGLAAASAATIAIMQAAGATGKSMAVVAQAFGFGVIATELAANSYLYQLPPSATQNFVHQMQLAYREGAAAKHLLINSPTAAYHQIQQYLSLCLPPTIEARIAEHIASAKAVPDTTSGNSPSIPIIIETAPGPTRSDVRHAVIPDVSAPMRPPQRAPQRAPTATGGAGVGIFEQHLLPSEIRLYQCLVGESEDGNFTTATRNKVLAFLNDNGIKDQAFKDQITDKDGVRLRRAARAKGCKLQS
jgi:hypothetical protein